MVDAICWRRRHKRTDSLFERTCTRTRSLVSALLRRRLARLLGGEPVVRYRSTIYRVDRMRFARKTFSGQCDASDGTGPTVSLTA